jgi:ribonuclease HII
MSVAMASMVAKYLRECLMDRYNLWWADQVPGIERTAGYYGDGGRFLREIESRRVELGIATDRLVRSR